MQLKFSSNLLNMIQQPQYLKLYIQCTYVAVIE